MTRSGRPAPPRIVVLTRYPRPGRTKTRLAAALGDDGAAALHSALARHCVRRMHAASLSRSATLEVRVAGAGPRQTRRWLGRAVEVREQAGGGLGDRLAHAARCAIEGGAPAVVLVGSDAPQLGGAQVREALDALAHTDVVLGPALDGGYYLVAFSARAADRAVGPLFGSHVAWGTGSVLDDTLAATRSAGLAVHLLEPLADVDRPEDLAAWEALLADDERARHEARLSVVIPTLNEEDTIAASIDSAWGAGAREVIVADGGSLDRTADRAAHAGARVIEAERGRARQMNAGARAADGDVLLFLHADTVLPRQGSEQVRAVMSDPDVVLGSFSFAAGDPAVPLDRLITTVGAWRHRVSRLPYGDQAQFVRARDFADLGGFADLPVMEDYEFALRCSRFGRIGAAASAARSSARAWHEHGLVRTTVTNAAVIAGYRLGVPAERLAGWRRTVSERSGGRG